MTKKREIPQKKKKEIKGTPIAPWMVTFADMMTLLLVFFVLILSFSTMEQERFRAISMALQNSFGFQMMNPLNLIPVDNPPRTENVVAPIRPEPPTTENTGTENQLDALGNRLQTNFTDEIERGLIIVEHDEDHIIIRFPDDAAFGPASDWLEPQMVPIIQRVGDLISEFDMYVIVGGHTDNIPIHNQRYRSNWELSAARAVSVAHELTWMSDLNEEYLYVVGNGDARPIASNATPEERARNRRVDILLMERDITDEREVFQGIQQIPTYR
ncbi:flagellar motor protein MotB [Marinospirillum sp. MEB164]|uniref:Flagellar motor protein MotB n=1 Tax=Marinospirillum alkalitolerans TaxID=3123374 RepID=A0ABW8PZK3_9GAMM